MSGTGTSSSWSSLSHWCVRTTTCSPAEHVCCQCGSVTGLRTVTSWSPPAGPLSPADHQVSLYPWVALQSERGERLPGEPPRAPFLHRPRADRGVESLRIGVPVQDRPLHPPVAAFDGDVGEFGQQRPPVSSPARGRADEQVLQVDAVPAEPGGEGPEPQREADDVTGRLLLGDQAEDGGFRREQGGVQLFGRGLSLLRLPFVGGQLHDELDEDGDVVDGGRADHRYSLSSCSWVTATTTAQHESRPLAGPALETCWCRTVTAS